MDLTLRQVVISNISYLKYEARSRINDVLIAMKQLNELTIHNDVIPFERFSQWKALKFMPANFTVVSFHMINHISFDCNQLVGL